jgi:hypothetical protein
MGTPSLLRARRTAAAKSVLVCTLTLALLGLGSSTSRSATLDAGAASDYATAVLADAPAANWRLDELDGSQTAQDSSGHGFNGTYAQGAAPGADVAGALPFETDTAGAFTATVDSPYANEIQLGNPVGLPAGQAPFTFEAWVATETPGTAIAGREDGYTDSPPGWVVYLDSTGRVNALLSAGKWILQAAGPGIDASDGAWHHIVVAFDPAGVQRVSVDGLIGSDAQIRRPYVPVGRTPGEQVDTSGTTIGDVTGYANFQGTIDEVTLYPGALPMSRVSAHYRAAQGDPAAYPDEVATEDANGWWKLDDASTGVASDSSGYGYDGMSANVGSDPGPLDDGSTAGRFGGTSSVAIPDRPELNPGTGDFGVEAWARTTATSGERVVAAKGAPSGPCNTQPYWKVAITDAAGHAGNAELVYDDLATRDANGCGVAQTVYGPSLRLDDGLWHHLLVSVTRGGLVQIDSDAFETTRAGATSGDLTNAAPLTIGSGFSGDLAQVAYYPYALDPSRIAVHIAAAHVLEPTLGTDEAAAGPDLGPWDPVDTEDPGGPTLFAARAAAATATPTAELLHNTANYVDVTNRDGTWRIYKRCLGPAERARQSHANWDGNGASAVPNDHPGFSVGPGYVAMLTRADGKVVVDDNREASFLNGVGMGGIGTFGFHWARAAKTTANGPFDPGGGDNRGDVFNLDGRVCAEDTSTGQNSQGSGFGVAAGSTVEQISKKVSFNDGQTGVFLLMKVDFKDPWVDGIAQVEYRYRFEPDTVKVWIHVAFCVHACNLKAGVDDAHRYAFIKEPKFMTTARGAGAPTSTDASHCTSLQPTPAGSTVQPECRTDYVRMTGITTTGRVGLNSNTTPNYCAWSENGFNGDPANWGIGDTGHCGAPMRLFGRWDFDPAMGPGVPPSGGSCATKPCLQVKMEGYPLTGTKTAIPPTSANGYRPHLWDATVGGRPGVGGLDLMALKYLSQQKTLVHPPFDPKDSAVGSTAASNDNCHLGDVHTGKYTITSAGKTKTLQVAKRAGQVRNWELIGGKQVDPATNKQTAFESTGKPYETASIMFSGWQGGNGYDDCEDLARLMPNKTDIYNVYGEYGLSTH